MVDLGLKGEAFCPRTQANIYVRENKALCDVQPGKACCPPLPSSYQWPDAISQRWHDSDEGAKESPLLRDEFCVSPHCDPKGETWLW